ncbi:hypothetical protein BaRGS_00029766 [Batillaria attramentaria]|uniref:Uncharacterized protein n=1 Tax=Batillaria attramentaria TaxID=370345 RepID=A0ABD0JWM2_9CAEN
MQTELDTARVPVCLTHPEEHTRSMCFLCDIFIRKIVFSLRFPAAHKSCSSVALGLNDKSRRRNRGRRPSCQAQEKANHWLRCDD